MEYLTAQICEEVNRLQKYSRTEEKSECSQIKPCAMEYRRFPDGELRPQIQENIRGKTVFIVQSTNSYENIAFLLLTIDAAHRASAQRIIPVVPYFGSGRQEQKDRPRVPISAALWAKCIKAAGATSMLSVDLHDGAIQGFFDGSWDHLYGSFVLIPALRQMLREIDPERSNTVVVAPDRGRVKLNLYFAEQLGIKKFLFCGKRKSEDKKTAETKKEVIYIDGELPQSAVCIMIDDMIDTAGTIESAAWGIAEKGIREEKTVLRIIVAATHALLSPPALGRIQDSPITDVLVTDTIPPLHDGGKITYHSIAPVLAEAIYCIAQNKSISSLFNRDYFG